MLNPSLKTQARALHERFASASPFKHVVIDDFLKKDVAEKILKDFPSEAHPERLKNEFGDPNPKSARPDIENLPPSYGELDKYISGSAFLDFMGKVTGIPNLQYDPYYFGAGTHENFHGAGLDAHYDFNIHPKTGLHRRLNAIVYLNKDWDPDWGGQICLHEDAWDKHNKNVCAVDPAFNRCVIFETTESSWHSVRTIKTPGGRTDLSRKSFTIYLYTPIEDPELAPHGTVYVPEHLPDHITAGHKLSKKDADRVQFLVDRRNHMLRNLYRRELVFGRELERLKSALGDAKANQRLPVIGYGKLTGLRGEVYSDGWIGRTLSAQIEPVKAVRSINVSLSVPKQAKAATFTVSAGGQEATAKSANGRVSARLEMSDAVSAPFTLTITAEDTLALENGDERELAAMLDAVELVHDTPAS